MNYLQISSAGLLDNEALTLIGASTKKGDDTKIGIYGSGFKYALANILRNKLSFRVFSGLREIKVTTKEVEFRGKIFEQIFIDGKETSLTTDMGGDEWEAAFPVFRELYSNALDEGNADLRVKEEPYGIEDKTCIYIEYTDKYREFFENFNSYFTQRRMDARAVIKDFGYNKAKTVTVYPKLGSQKGIRIFRKGILAFNNESHPSMFDYDLEHGQINESRILTNQGDARQSIWDAWNLCDDAKLFNEYIMGLTGANAYYYEHDCLSYDWRTPILSPMVKDYLESRKWVAVEHVHLFEEHELKGRYSLPLKFLKNWNQVADLDIFGITEDNVNFIKKELNEYQFDKFADAQVFLKKFDRYRNMDKDFKYEFGVFPSETDVLAKAVPDNNTVRLTPKLFDKSVPEVAKVLIEEIEHVLTGYADYSRRFQDHLFDLYYNELEKVTNLKQKYNAVEQQPSIPNREI